MFSKGISSFYNNSVLMVPLAQNRCPDKPFGDTTASISLVSCTEFLITFHQHCSFVSETFLVFYFRKRHFDGSNAPDNCLSFCNVAKANIFLIPFSYLYALYFNAYGGFSNCSRIETGKGVCKREIVSGAQNRGLGSIAPVNFVSQTP